MRFNAPFLFIRRVGVIVRASSDLVLGVGSRDARDENRWDPDVSDGSQNHVYIP